VQPPFADFLSRFSDAFGVHLHPAVLIVRDDLFERLRKTNAIPSFRDVIALSVIPYSRALNIVHRAGGGIYYGASFWLYPWMVGDNQGHMTLSTPALSAFHVLTEFHGQSSPEMPHLELRKDQFDEALFNALMKRWKRHHLTRRQLWEDRALFRSLNMAAQATQPPAGSDVTLYDLFRMTALWVGAFEMLTHPRKGSAGLQTVYPMLERVTCLDATFRKKKYIAHMGRMHKPWPRRTLPCWLYGKLYRARNKYLHGDRVTLGLLSDKRAQHGLFWLAAPLYRFALTGFLRLEYKRTPPPATSSPHGADSLRSEWPIPSSRKKLSALCCVLAKT
jgi:hypothetical protein